MVRFKDKIDFTKIKINTHEKYKFYVKKLPKCLIIVTYVSRQTWMTIL